VSRSHHDLAALLNSRLDFPRHGIVRLAEGGEVLVFPFLRATWELWQHNKESSRQRKVKVADSRAVGYFQERWFRVLYVLRKITSIEKMLQSEGRGFEWIDAHKELPCWLDLYFFYLHMLADAMVVSIGRLLSDAPESFPQEAKNFFREDAWAQGSKLRCDAEGLLATVARHRGWFDLIRPPEGKGIRDSLVHRLCRWQVVLCGEGEVDWPKTVQATLEGVASDIAPEEGLDAIEKTMSGLCDFLSALPGETWLNTAFEAQDLVTSNRVDSIGGRFLPALTVEL
jgi:hypothetical protein